MPKEEFRREVEKELTGVDEEPTEPIFFKVYKSQIPAIEQAIETAGLMLGSGRSRGYCLEMICADFLAGAHIEGTDLALAVVTILLVIFLIVDVGRALYAYDWVSDAARRATRFAMVRGQTCDPLLATYCQTGSTPRGAQSSDITTYVNSLATGVDTNQVMINSQVTAPQARPCLVPLRRGCRCRFSTISNSFRRSSHAPGPCKARRKE